MRANATTDRLAATVERAQADAELADHDADRERSAAARDANSAERDEIATARSATPQAETTGGQAGSGDAGDRDSAMQSRVQLADGRRVAASALARQKILDANLAIEQEREADRQAARELSPDVSVSDRQAAIAVALPMALARQELSLCFQPVYHLVEQRIVGFEALLRWTSAELGVVTPDEFIPVAEATGEITVIGDWVLLNALSTLATWRQDRPERQLGISVNVAPEQFAAPGFASRVGELLTATNVPPGALTLEITERTLADDAPALCCVMENLRAIGVRLSVDDFGTGFSSLARLSAFPLDELKIDRIFVSGVAEDQRQRALVAGIVAMSNALDLRVVAEGIETLEQNNIVRGLGCHLGQGFLMSRPLQPTALRQLLAA